MIVCPKCGSENCGCFVRSPDSPYKCYDCGYMWLSENLKRKMKTTPIQFGIQLPVSGMEELNINNWDMISNDSRR